MNCEATLRMSGRRRGLDINTFYLLYLCFLNSNIVKTHLEAPSPFRGLGFEDRINFTVPFLGN